MTKYYGIVNGHDVVAANNMNTLKRKAAMIANKTNLEIDNMAVYAGKTFLNNFIRITEKYGDGRTIRSDWT